MEIGKKIYRITFCAIMIALSSVLSLIKVWQMPLGGSVTLLSMLPVVTVSVFLGLKWGFASSFIYSLIQLFFGITLSGMLGWGLTPLSLFAAIFLDYIFAFTVLGISGIFRKKGYFGICAGVSLAVFLRFICHLISGAVVFDIWCEWDNAFIYSFCYNGAYMLPELIITAVGATASFRSSAIKKLVGFNE